MTLSAQYKDFLIHRRDLRHDLQRRAAEMPQATLWELASVLVSGFSVRKIDFNSLAFLFDRSDGIDVHEHLLVAEQHYEALRTVGEALSENVQKMHREIVDLHLKGAIHGAPGFEEAIGIDRIALTSELLKGVVREIQSEHYYLKAFDELRKVLAKRFPKKPLVPPIGPGEGYAEEDLPRLPAALHLAAPNDHTRRNHPEVP